MFVMPEATVLMFENQDVVTASWVETPDDEF